MHKLVLILSTLLASLMGCRTTSDSGLANAPGASSTSAEADDVVLTPEMTNPPTWQAVAAHGGAFSGYYRVASCTTFAKPDRSDAGTPANAIFLPIVGRPKDVVFVLGGYYQKDQTLILVVQGKDKLQINGWTDRTIGG